MNVITSNDTALKATQCQSCKKFFNESLGVCPFCGTVVAAAAKTVVAPQSVSATQVGRVPTPEAALNAVKNSAASLKNKKFLWLGLLCYVIAQILAWAEPWTKLSANYAAGVLSNPKIHYLNYLESSGSILKNYYQADVDTDACTAAIFLTLASAMAALVYFVMILIKTDGYVTRWIFGSGSLIVSAVLVEGYRISVNTALSELKLSEIYSFSSTGISLAVVALAIAALLFNRAYRKNAMQENALNESRPIETTEQAYCCGQCGQEGPYEGNCPNCGSSVKAYKVNNESASQD